MTPTQAKIICVTCPKGCTLDVTHDGQTVLKVDSGCKRGDAYARQELLDPRRMVTTTLRVIGSNHLLIPVVTSEAFPKGQIQELLAELRQRKCMHQFTWGIFSWKMRSEQESVSLRAVM